MISAVRDPWMAMEAKRYVYVGNTVKIRDTMSFNQAATYACAGVTAWNALAVAGRVKPGDTVLVQGSGGVSIFALQIARLLGGRVIATSSSDEKLERMKSLGAEFGINYKTTPDWASAVREYTGGEGVHHVVEVAGGDKFSQALQAARMAGTVSVIGILSGVDTTISLLPFLHKHLTVNGIFVGSRVMLEDLLKAPLIPIIDKTFPFPKAQEALRYLESGKHFGKVVIQQEAA